MKYESNKKINLNCCSGLLRNILILRKGQTLKFKFLNDGVLIEKTLICKDNLVILKQLNKKVVKNGK